eukprot:756179-Hanusia_phi.AAC.1
MALKEHFNVRPGSVTGYHPTPSLPPSPGCEAITGPGNFRELSTLCRVFDCESASKKRLRPLDRGILSTGTGGWSQTTRSGGLIGWVVRDARPGLTTAGL